MLPHNLTAAPMLGGDDGTAQTLTAMRELVASGQVNPWTRSALLTILGPDITEKSGRSELGAILDFVRSRVRYMRDPVDAEYVQDPAFLLEQIRAEGWAAGDCDDMATLFATLAEAAGYPTRFVVVGPDTGAFSHVYVQADVDGAWINADPSAKGRPLGWAPPAPAGRRAAMYLGQDTETSWLSDLTSGLKDLSTSAIPLLERYGVLEPQAAVTPTGTPLLPVGGAYGATYSALATAGPLGLSWGVWLGVGAVGALLLLSGGRRR